MRWRSFPFLLLMLATACDIPTELPRWNPTFAVPLEPISIPLAQLLPAGVALTPAGSAFVVSLPPVNIRARLVELCGACGTLDGQIVSKPAFTGSSTARIPMPRDVISGTFTGGVVQFTITNGWTFDPLRPGGGQLGTMILRPAAQPIEGGSAVVSGQTRAFPPGATLTESVPIAPATLESLPLEVHLASPAGDPVLIDGQSALTMTIAPLDLIASSVRVQVGARQLTSPQVPIDLTGVDDVVVRRVNGGMLRLTIANGFDVAGNMTLTLAGGLMPVVKTFTLQAGETAGEVMLTEAELKSILGQSVVASLTGLMTTNGAVRLTPASVFSIEWLLVLEMGSATP